MKNLINSINFCRIFAFCLLLLGLISCESRARYVMTNLSDRAEFPSHTVNLKGLSITIDTITLEEVDKRRGGVRIFPDEIDVELNLLIVNNLDEDVLFCTRVTQDYYSSYFYGYFNAGILDSVAFVNHWLPDSVVIRKGEKYYMNLVSGLYRFDRLFKNKDNYTDDMVKLVNSMHFKYIDPTDSSCKYAFYPNSKTQLFSKNTKNSYHFRFLKSKPEGDDEL